MIDWMRKEISISTRSLTRRLTAIDNDLNYVDEISTRSLTRRLTERGQ